MFFKITDRISLILGTVCSWISGLAVFVLMMEVVVDVVMRKLVGSGLSGGFEYAQILMIFVVFFALAHTQQQKGTVHVTFFVVRFQGKLRYIVWALGMLIALATAVLFTWGSYEHGLLMIKAKTMFATTLVPFWPFYMMGAVTWGMFTIILLFDTIKSFAAIFCKKYAEEVSSEWAS